MGTLAILLAWAVGAVVAVTGVMHALIFVLRPLLVWLLPDDMFGPDGMYVDTKSGEGILDSRWNGRWV
jgi:hypothetical protein